MTSPEGGAFKCCKMAAVRLLRSVARWRSSGAIRVWAPAYSRRMLSMSSLLYSRDKLTHTGQVGLAKFIYTSFNHSVF